MLILFINQDKLINKQDCSFCGKRDVQMLNTVYLGRAFYVCNDCLEQMFMSFNITQTKKRW